MTTSIDKDIHVNLDMYTHHHHLKIIGVSPWNKTVHEKTHSDLRHGCSFIFLSYLLFKPSFFFSLLLFRHNRRCTLLLLHQWVSTVYLLTHLFHLSHPDLHSFCHSFFFLLVDTNLKI
ncbi:unnamed protein product [Brassica oleracea var. botrytis]